MAPAPDLAPLAVVGGWLLTDLADVTSDLAALDSSGTWAVVLPFSGDPVCARFRRRRPARPWPGPPWPGVVVPGRARADLGVAGHDRGDDAFGEERGAAGRDPLDGGTVERGGPAAWTSSLDEASFRAGVAAIRAAIAAGDVYQVNLTRRLTAPGPPEADVAALGAALAAGHPAPFSAVVRLPAQGVHVASASPERFLERDGRRVWSSPIKGTAATSDGFLAKDTAENVMIVDLVRNDLGRVCEWGSVTVPALCAVERHPGLVHLVSTVEGRLRPGAGWAEVVAATFPPGSVTGAPKVAALGVIDALEPVERGVYCGAVGWVDADATRGALNVAIRTFWLDDGLLHFGTGGGITWDSDPAGEWAETELKAARLLPLASRGNLVP